MVSIPHYLSPPPLPPYWHTHRYYPAVPPPHAESTLSSSPGPLRSPWYTWAAAATCLGTEGPQLPPSCPRVGSGAAAPHSSTTRGVQWDWQSWEKVTCGPSPCSKGQTSPPRPALSRKCRMAATDEPHFLTPWASVAGAGWVWAAATPRAVPQAHSAAGSGAPDSREQERRGQVLGKWGFLQLRQVQRAPLRPGRDHHLTT